VRIYYYIVCIISDYPGTPSSGWAD